MTVPLFSNSSTVGDANAHLKKQAGVNEEEVDVTEGSGAKGVKHRFCRTNEAVMQRHTHAGRGFGNATVERGGERAARGREVDGARVLEGVLRGTRRARLRYDTLREMAAEREEVLRGEVEPHDLARVVQAHVDDRCASRRSAREDKVDVIDRRDDARTASGVQRH